MASIGVHGSLLDNRQQREGGGSRWHVMMCSVVPQLDVNSLLISWEAARWASALSPTGMEDRRRSLSD